MNGRHRGKARRGQFLILTAAVLVLAVILISSILNTAIISRTEYVETNFREVTQKISTDFPKALESALSNASLTYKASASMTQALLNAEIYLANWRANILNAYVGFGIRLNISDPVVELDWNTPDEGRSSITASVELALTTLGFSGWNDTGTVEAYAHVLRSPESVIVTPNKVSFNMTFVKEDGSPVASLTSDLLKIKTHYVGAQKAYQDLNMSTATLRYFGNGLYNITARTDQVIDAFQLTAYDDRGIVVCLTTNLAVSPDLAIVKSIKLTTSPDRTKAVPKVVSTLNVPIEGATIYGHWEGNVSTTDRQPIMIKTNSSGMALFTAASSSLFKTNGTKNSNVGKIVFKVDDVLFVPIINITGPSTSGSAPPSPAWSNPTYAFADGGTSASALTSNAVVTYSNYNLKIPSSSKIMNVWLRLDSWTSGDDNIRVEISYNNGITFPWSVFVNPPNAGSEPSPSNTYPLWIQLNSTSPSGWNVTQLTTTPFFIRITKNTIGSSNTVYLDFVPIVVLFQPNYVYEPLRSVTQVVAVKRCASTFVGTWSNPAYALRNDTQQAYAYTSSSTMILQPNAGGTYQQWTTFGSGSSHWDRTSDQSDITGVLIAGSTTAQETENLQNTTQTGTINSVTAYMRARESGQTLEYDTVTFDAASSTTTNAISYRTGTGSTGTGSSSSGSAITINSGDFVIAQIAIVGTSTTVTRLTLGTGNTMTLLDGPRDYSTNVRSYLYYYSASSNLGSVTPTLTLSGSVRHAWTLSVYTGCATSAPYFENVNYATGSGSSPVTASVTVSSGTTGRLVVSGTAIADTSNGAYTISIAPAGSPVETERQEQRQAGSFFNRAVSSQLEDYASDTSRTNSAVGTASGRTLAWVEQGVAILPARSMSWTHTVGTGNNRLLLVNIGTYSTTGTPATVSSITYGGAALTLVASNVYPTNPQVRSYLYQLTNPTSGSNTISVSFSGYTLAVGGSASYFNVNQTTPIQSSGTNIGSGTTQSVSLTPTGTYNTLFYASMMSYQTTSYSVTEGSGQTNRWSQIGSTYKGRGSEKTVTGGTSQTMSWTTGSSVSWVATGAIIIPTKTANPVEQAVILWRTHDTNYLSSAFTISRTAFSNYSYTSPMNPNTGLPWTWAEVNASQIGAIASTLGASETIQVSEFWIVVNYVSNSPTEIYSNFGFNIPSEAIITYVDLQSDLWLQNSGNDYVNISISRDSGINWIPTQPFSVNPLTTAERTYHTNATRWYKWSPNDLNGNNFQVNITKVTNGVAEQVNLDYLATYVVYYIKPTLSPPFMHVDDISLSQQGTSPTRLRANVKIVDARLEPVSTATVSVRITDMTNLTSWVLNVNTNSNGVAAFTLTGVQVGRMYALNVNTITKTDWIYDTESNYKSTASYTVT